MALMPCDETHLIILQCVTRVGQKTPIGILPMPMPMPTSKPTYVNCTTACLIGTYVLIPTHSLCRCLCLHISLLTSTVQRLVR